ncbi:MAG: class I SAM-dependent methyltransferase [Bacteroidales bacterium]
MNQALSRLNDEYTMLHYPYFLNEGESFHTSQKNLTDYCISRLPSLEGKHVLEVGCGNGLQAIYMMNKYSPASITAIDLNASNIAIAKGEAAGSGLKNIEFKVGDAQNLVEIKDHSIDYVINIESAFHYPDKPAFIKEISRVLKPGGYFLIADILTIPVNRNALKKFWKRRMHFNHWTKRNYEIELSRTNLHLESFSDITDQTIQGFRGYRDWMRNMKRKAFLGDLFLKLFYIINVRLTIMLLRKRRLYAVFSGRKAGLNEEKKRRHIGLQGYRRES